MSCGRRTHPNAVSPRKPLAPKSTWRGRAGGRCWRWRDSPFLAHRQQTAQFGVGEIAPLHGLEPAQRDVDDTGTQQALYPVDKVGGHQSILPVQPLGENAAKAQIDRKDIVEGKRV